MIGKTEVQHFVQSNVFNAFLGGLNQLQIKDNPLTFG